MNIISTQYTLKYKSFEIVISGCKGENGVHCKGCHSPETWNFDIGENYENQIDFIITKINEAKNMIDWLWIYGGEPMDNNISELEDMLQKLAITQLPIVLFTRKSIDDVPNNIKKYCTYIKCGAYIPKLKTDNNIQYGIQLATSNQKIYKKVNNIFITKED